MVSKMCAKVSLKNTFLEFDMQGEHVSAELPRVDSVKRQTSDGILWEHSNPKLQSHCVATTATANRTSNSEMFVVVPGHASVQPTHYCLDAVDTSVKQQISDGIRWERSNPKLQSHSVSPIAASGRTSDNEILCNDGAPSAVTTLVRDIALAGGGLSGLMTAMFRNVPLRYSQTKLMAELNRSGFKDSYDFFYLPRALRSNRNRGFGFINFLQPELAERFYRRYHGGFLRSFHEPATEPLQILPADVQGFEASARAAIHSTPALLRAPSESASTRQEATRQRKSLQRESRKTGTRAQTQKQDAASIGLPAMPAPEFLRAPVEEDPVPVLVQRFCAFCGRELPTSCCFCPYCGGQTEQHNADAMVPSM